MAKFKFVAKNQQGQTITEIIEAENQQAVIDSLRKKQFIIISIVSQKSSKRLNLSFDISFGKAVKIDDLVVFSRQLATMVSAGLPIVQSLDILSEQIENKRFRAIVSEIKNNVETGSSLSEAMAKHSNAFSDLFVHMVSAGEASGMLDDILDRLAGYLESTSKLMKRINSALVYPIVVLIMAVVITLFMLIKVVPTFKGIFEGFGEALPVPTLILLQISDTLRHYFLIVFGIFIFVTFVVIKYINTPKGKLRFDTITLNLPIFGKLVKKIAISRFARTLSTLTKSGVSILTALDIVGKTSGNKVIEIAVQNVRESIKEGESIASPLAKAGIFPPLVVRMISVGEQTGSLEEMLTKISDFYDSDVTSAVEGLTSLIEPAVMVFLGGVIGSIVVALYLPVFKIGELIR
ncbi:MAG: type II secretion system F family protein [Candidatus Omnitrophota bacterium]